MDRKKTFRLILLIGPILLGLIIQSCGPSDPAPVPTVTLASQDFVQCAAVTPISFPIVNKPKDIFVLIDRSGSYGAYTEAGVDILIQGLILSVGPGDRLHLIWLGASEGDSMYWLVDTVPDVRLPSLIPPLSTFTASPTALPTTTPTEATPVDTPDAVLRQQASEQTATAQADYWTVTANAASAVATNTAIQAEKDINQQRCDQAAINNQNQILISKWQELRDQTVRNFVEQALAPLKSSTGKGTDRATHLYNSLYYVTRTILQEKDTNFFGSYDLIILSDMEDRGSADGKSLDVNLTGVKVLMAMVPCNQSIDCQNRSNYWESYFKDHGAILPTYPFKLVDETTPYVISDFLK